MAIEKMMEMFDMTREEVEEILFSQSLGLLKKIKKVLKKT